MAPKTLPKRLQNGCKISEKMDIEIDQNFACLLSGLLEALGGQHGPKSLPKRSPEGVGKCSRFWAWKGLGGLLGALGAQDPPRADFWTQLGPTWLHDSPNLAQLGPNLAPTWPILASTWPQLGHKKTHVRTQPSGKLFCVL